MAYILYIETTTKNCSVALAKNNILIDEKEISSENYSHSENLTVFIKDLVEKNKLEFNQLNAIAISEGPGSYTGLRIGTSTAKGLCFALKIPLISVNTLKGIASFAKEKNKASAYFSMIDARRMEVFLEIFDKELNSIAATVAQIIDEEYLESITEKNIVFCGDGVHKFDNLVKDKKNIIIHEFQPSAKHMIEEGYNKFINKKFEDVAYFEPFYLKDFIAGKPKKLF